ncbi:MAG TPA: hypothetical protein PKC24_13635, partial [Cyclobacteriaceae bacterium]|nr:hypothetical protein [Cyclobacteriaceae bacterium]
MVAEERYEFKAETRKKILIVGVVGIVLLALGLLFSGGGAHHDEHEGHAMQAMSESMVASADADFVLTADAHDTDHHGSSTIVK